MASQSNHNASYIFEVDGITVWERLRVIRSFLANRRESLTVAEINRRKSLWSISKIADPEEAAFEQEIFEARRPEMDDAMQKCRDEIAFLEKFESDLVALAEQTRIPGKTDEEMYEINFYNEIITRNVRRAHAEIAATGQVSPDTIKYLMKCPPALDVLTSQGLLQGDNISKLVNNGKLANLGYADDIVDYNLLTHSE